MDVVSQELLLCESFDAENDRNFLDVDEVIISDSTNKRGAVNSGMVMNSSRKNNVKDHSDSFANSFECLTKDKHVASARRAFTVVKTIWNGSNDMVENGFGEVMFIPELLILNAGMIKLALNCLQVAPSVIRNGDDIFFEFMYCIKQQRRKIKNDFVLLKQFDKSWGLNAATGHFHSVSRSSCSDNYIFFLREERVDQLIQAEYQETAKLSAQKSKQISSLSDSSAFDSWTGIHILHLFIVDLIGRHNAAAVIFHEKAKQE